MSNVVNDEVLNELRRITKLLALMATKDHDQMDQVVTLNKVGFTSKEIAEVLNINPSTVRTTLHRKRKSPGGTKKTGTRKKANGD